MADAKTKHPSWFKLKIERRQLLKQLPPETTVNALLACLDYLETRRIPDTLQPVESAVFAAFFQDLEESWVRYEQRINAKAGGQETDQGGQQAPPGKPDGDESTRNYIRDTGMWGTPES